jgi:hypothetical protein
MRREPEDAAARDSIVGTAAHRLNMSVFGGDSGDKRDRNENI